MITRGFDSGVMATFVAPRALWALPKDKYTATSLVQMEQVSNPSEGHYPFFYRSNAMGI
jgi:hypothetical protein